MDIRGYLRPITNSAMLHTVSLVFVQFLLVSALKVYHDDCSSPYNRHRILKATPNCGDNQCYCSNSSAICVGDDSVYTIPSIKDDITELYALCYNLKNASSESFDNVNASIKVIHLKDNQIRNMSRDIFNKFHQLSEVHIENERDINITEFWDALGSIQKSTVLNLTINNIGIVNLTEESFAKINKSNIHMLDLSENRLKELPMSLFNDFKSLQVLNFARNWIRHIDIEDAYPIKSLTTLDLQDNHIDLEGLAFCRNNNVTNGSLFPSLAKLLLNKNVISSDNMSTWDCLSSLKELNLRSNKLKQVNITLFSSLTSLEKLNLRENWIYYVIPGIFPPKLRNIDLQKNEMSVFPPKMCEENSTNSWNNSVTYLNLSGNYIQRIMIKKWDCLQKLEYLDLGKNDISEYRNDTFYPLESLKHLYLDNMVPNIHYVGPDAFRTQTGTLETLILRYNMISFTREETQLIFRSCPNVTFLDISYNFFNDLTEEEFVEILSPMKGLRKLKALRIRLQKFPSSLLKTFRSLEYLDINRNHLNTIEFPEEFSNENMNLSLRELHVAECAINTMDDKAFPVAITRSLRKLDVSRNEFACVCKLRWFRDKINENGYIFQVKLLNWPHGYDCRSPKSLVGHMLKSFEPDEMCDLLTVGLVAAGVLLIVFCIIVGFIYWNRWYIQYWWYRITRCKKDIWSTDPERLPLMNQIHFDGYVVQDSDDDDFVHHTFLDIIEKKLNYELFVWKRDAKNGALVDVILDGMQASRQVIIIVSSKSIKNQWCKFQVDVAIDRSVHLRRQCVLLVVLEDTDFKHMSKSWCVLLAKTPKAYWNNDVDANDIKRKLFEQTVIQHFGPPLSEREICGHSVN